MKTLMGPKRAASAAVVITWLSCVLLAAFAAAARIVPHVDDAELGASASRFGLVLGFAIGLIVWAVQAARVRRS